MSPRKYVRKHSPPPPGWVNTREAARMWGCTTVHLRTQMREAGISPIIGNNTQRQGRSFYWDPQEVLAVRAIVRKRLAQLRERPLKAPKPTAEDRREARQADRRYRALAREGQLRWLREYYLDKAKRKRGEL